MSTTPIAAIPDRIATAFRAANTTTGTNFEFLLKTAYRESGLDPNARAPTSSAAGLFQFIESTWLETMSRDGARLGYGDYAGHVERTGSGKYVVRDAEMRAEILNLRYDPAAASALAGAFAARNAAHLHESLGRAPTHGELYIAHFLGASGGARLIEAAAAEPEADAAKMFPAPARANRAVFYAGDQARTAAEVYAVLVRGYDINANEPVVAAATAAEEGATTLDPLPALRVASAFTEFSAGDPSTVFQALFRTDPAADAVTQPVDWTAFRAATDDPAPRTPAPVVPQTKAKAKRPGGPLDLTAFLAIQGARKPAGER